MSRCVKFPPQGFVWNGASGESLLELLQVRREEAAEEKKRKKKEKRRTKEENEELEEGEIRESECSQHKQKKSKNDHENQMLLELERSSLTEEHELPVCDISLSDSSDNTEYVMPKCSIQNSTAFVDDKAETDSTTSSSENCLQHIESRFRELIENFAPSPIQTEHNEFDDQEWLFERRQPMRNANALSSACNDDDDDSCHESSSLYPCSLYLPQADIYALPYTVLF